jgi:hypothetical protein
MHKTEKTAKESRMNYMYSHLCDTTLGLPFLDLPVHWRPDLGTSDEQKEIESLKQKLKLYQDNCPKPSILILDKQGSPKMRSDARLHHL